MRRIVSFYPDSDRISDVTDKPYSWHIEDASVQSEFQGVVDDEVVWQEYEAAYMRLQEASKKLETAIQRRIVWDEQEREFHARAEELCELLTYDKISFAEYLQKEQELRELVIEHEKRRSAMEHQ